MSVDLQDVGLVNLAHEFAELLQEGAIKEWIDKILTVLSKAVKLFSNTYLTWCVVYFNQLEIYTQDTKW